MTTALTPIEILPAESSWAGKVTVTETSLEIDTALPFDAWVELMAYLGRARRFGSWFIGDGLLEGFSQYGDRYSVGEAATGLERESLYRLRWVAEKVDSSRRNKELDFESHAAVASLSPDEQSHWLQLAENEGWPYEMLREKLRAAGKRQGPPPPIRFSLTLPPTEQPRAERWQHAADDAGLEFGEWAARALDQAAEVIEA